MLGKLPGEDVPFCDLDFLVFEVTGKLNDLHPVLERQWNVVPHIRRRYEEDRGKIVVDIQVVVRKGNVLLRVENFEKRG